MSKKNLNVSSIANELQGASLYFTASPAPEPAPQTASQESPAVQDNSLPISDPLPTPASQDDRYIQQKPDRKPKRLASSGASMLAYKRTNKVSPNFDKPNDLIETIRKTVKQVGKEPLFVRATPEEKQRLSSLVYAFNDMYRGEGRKTSENEIGRIAINWLLEDYQANGEASILTQVLAALNA